MDKKTDIVFCGVGGDGIILASKILCRAALKSKLRVKSSENRGHGKRGGAVLSNVRLGASHSPIIPEGYADIIVAFNERELLRNIHLLRGGGMILAGFDTRGGALRDYLVMTCIPQCGWGTRPQNMIFLGILASKIGSIKKRAAEESITESVSERTVVSNLAGFEEGYLIGGEYE